MHPIQRDSILLRPLLLPVLFHLVTGVASCAPGDASPAPSPAPLVTQFRITPAPGARSGPLHVTVGGIEKQIAEEAVKAWVLRQGRLVAYSGLDGSGGFENEGQSLRLWDAGSGTVTRVLSGYYLITNVTEATSSRQEPALIVEQEDGVRGVRHLSVVDPARGEVFFQKWAGLDSARDGELHVNVYREEDWEVRFDDPEAKVEPRGKEVRDLHELLKGRVIENPEMR